MTVSFEVTRRELVLGSRDSETGWREPSYSETTIEMIIVPRGARHLALLAGAYPVLDAVGLTADLVSVGDQILDGNSEYWDVESIEPVYWGDSFVYRRCHLRHMVLHG